MALRIMSVVGEALNFGARRFETVARVGALPLGLSIVFNMAAVFAYLSVANNRLISFKDLSAAGVNYNTAKALANQTVQQGLMMGNTKIWTIFVASVLINTILVSSFMAPLIRYAGLGERPAPGFIRAPFGLDQLRYLGASALSFLFSAILIYGPVGAATFWIIKIVGKAASTPFAHFPDKESLHSIDIISGADGLTMRGVAWIYEYGYWSLGSIALMAVLFVISVAHYWPRPGNRSAGVIGRAAGVALGGGAYFAAAFLLLKFVAGARHVNLTLTRETLSVFIFFAAALAAMVYVNLRLYPYLGVAVCRRSMAFAGTFRVTRRFNYLRLGAAMLMIGAVQFAAYNALYLIAGGGVLTVLQYFYAGALMIVRFFDNAPGAGAWVAPFFQWLWAAIGSVFAFLWAFFTYGVSAGLLGRLYRDSENVQE